MTFPILDASDWPAAAEEQLGTKPKQWLAHPDTSEFWLWKESTWNVGKGGARYRKGDDWSERVACEVGSTLGLPVAEVELATRDGRVGVVSKRFLPEEAVLVHGNELLALQVDPHDRTGYTVDAVRTVLEEVEPPLLKPPLNSATDWFAGYLVLDALLGNTDRHIENWGVERLADGPTRLAPSFDHASCLGFLLDDAERAERLTTRDHNRTVRAYAERAQTRFDGKPHPVDVATSLLAHLGAEAQQHWMQAVAEAPSIEAVVGAVPQHRMSEAAKRFATALYHENHAKLSHQFRTLGP